MNSVYNIINRFVVDDKATRAVNKMAVSFTGLNNIIGRSKSLFSTLVTTGGTLGAVMLVTQLKRSLIDYNSELEQAKVSLGAIFNAAMNYKDPISGTWLQGMQKFNAAFGEASQLLWKFQKDSARSVGTLKDYIDISRQIADPIMRMGKNTEELRKFTNLTINAASVLGVDYPQASRDMMSALTGVAGIDVKLYRLLGSPGGGAKRFNALASQERFDLLVKAMERYSEATTAFEKTHKGLTSTLTDYGKIYLSFAGRPLFATWKSNLQELLEFVKQNEERMRIWSETIGNKLAKAFQILINGIKYLIDHRKDIATIFSLYMGTRIAKGLMGVNTIGGMYSKVGGFVDRAAEAKVVSQAGYPNLAFMAMYPTAGKVFQGFMGLGSSGGLMKAISKIVAALAKFAKASLIVAAVVLVIVGIFDALRNNTAKARDFILKTFTDLANSIYRLLFAPNSFGAQLWRVVKEILKVVGVIVVYAIGAAFKVVSVTLDIFVNLWNGIIGVLELFGHWMSQGIGYFLKRMLGMDGDLWSSIEDSFMWGWNQEKNYMGQVGGQFNTETWSKGWQKWTDDLSDMFGVPEETGTPLNQTIVNGGVHIYQEYKENMEPDRIAYATVELLNQLTRKPVQSKRSIIYA